MFTVSVRPIHAAEPSSLSLRTELGRVRALGPVLAFIARSAGKSDSRGTSQPPESFAEGEPVVLAAVHATRHFTPYHGVFQSWWVWALVLTTLLIAAVVLLTWESSAPPPMNRP